MTDILFMKRCLELAAKGIPSAFPNPAVGAVLVCDNRIIGEGYTSPYGGNHGEVNCIESVLDSNTHLISQSTLYVSLEPCSHFGKTPPCADLIVHHAIPKVVIGCVDTFSEVAGKGIDRLKTAGIEVVIGVLENECRELNKRFFTFHEKNRPFILLKWAQTKDGFIAPSKEKHIEERWITGNETKQFVHRIRGTEQAILVGKNTILMDDPSLTTRNYPGNNPIRIVIDKELKLLSEKENFHIFNEESETLILNKSSNFIESTNVGIKLNFEMDLPEQICKLLYERGIQSLIVEGGTQTLQSFIYANLWDEAYVFEGNKVFEEGTKGPIIKGKKVEKIEVGKDELTYSINPVST